MPPPSPNGSIGRSSNGRFSKGNPGGPGNPYAKRIATLRGCFLASVSDLDMIAITRQIIEMAKSGDISAIRLVMAYVIGEPGSMMQSTLDSEGTTILAQVNEIESSNKPK